MRDLTLTRHNAMVDPTLQIWGWEVPVYLFLGGLVAGTMIISGYFVSRGRHKEASCSCAALPLLSMVLLSIGMLALFMDLEHKLYAWRMYTTFQVASPMSWGAWILILVYPALFAGLLVRPPAFLTARFTWLKTLSGRLTASERALRTVGVVNMLLGAMLGIYTGILLSAFGARPLWNSPVLGLLFLFSGLSSAAALVHLVSRDSQESIMLARADNGFLTAELVILALFLIGMVTSTRVHIEAAQLILTGSFAPVFWVFVVGLGILIPLFVQTLAVRGRIHHTAVAPILVIAGGMVLRLVIVYAGQASHWTKTVLVK
jgi:formate-dependent nitrite reductase membrane component NrfD